DLGDGYILLPALDVAFRPVSDCKGQAFRDYIEHRGHHPPFDYILCVKRWARLMLPSRQIARSHWKEEQKPLSKLCASHHFTLEKQDRFGEVHFYFQVVLNDETMSLAFVSLFGFPNKEQYTRS
ncbi:hypothetical protein FISHEDRAFT_52736, partial [Fistulina hepatica ATCC 64428]